MTGSLHRVHVDQSLSCQAAPTVWTRSQQQGNAENSKKKSMRPRSVVSIPQSRIELRITRQLACRPASDTPTSMRHKDHESLPPIFRCWSTFPFLSLIFCNRSKSPVAASQLHNRQQVCSEHIRSSEDQIALSPLCAFLKLSLPWQQSFPLPMPTAGRRYLRYVDWI